jgi:hypothetical protein
MKNVCKTVIAAILLLVAVSPLRTQAAVSVYAEDVVSNPAAPTAESPAVTTASTANTDHTLKGSSDSGSPPVRIDETGIHVGGPNPVDINVPDLSRFRRERGMDLRGIFAIVGTFGMPVFIILIVFYFKNRRNKMAHETLRAMIEKGLPVTPELVAQIKGRGVSTSWGGTTNSGRLLPGLVLAGIGTALLIADSGRGKGGWIVLFIGVAFLIVWAVEQKNQNNQQPPR